MATSYNHSSLPVLTAEEMRAADRYTIEELRVSAEVLMERAGAVVFSEIERRRPEAKSFLIFVGKGNNGGDGLVVARLARERGKIVHLCPIDRSLASENCLSLQQAKAVMSDIDVIVDAVYGIGFRGSLPKELSNVFSISSSALRVAVDLPSGVECNTGQAESSFQADLTVTFQAYKPLHLLYPGAAYCGEIVVRDIGIKLAEFNSSVITREVVTQIVREDLLLSAWDYKNTRGHALVFAGSRGHSGAAALAGRSALRAGAGLVTVVADSETCQIAVSNTPELMSRELTTTSITEMLAKASSVVIGPGMAEDEGLLQQVLESAADKRVVLDATALRLLARGDFTLPEHSVLTPHPGELAEMLGESSQTIQADRLTFARLGASKYSRPVLLKGANSILALPTGKSFFIPFAHPNLGTAGSGDVLAGLIGGLLARGADFVGSILVASYLHGYSGSHQIPQGFAGDIASDFAERFSQAMVEIVQDKR